jgi:putative Mg2+ transporter-C (MgtC) family protein
MAQPFDFSWLEQTHMLSGAVGRLLFACLLGGLVGVERESRQKPAGLRTNLLIALGCAFFTILSIYLAGETNADKSRIASNIVQGIGFLGAGLILHNRNRVSGLSTAATVFVVASIGMACGAGQYAAAAAATAIVIVVLEFVGFMERGLNLKVYPQVYEARGTDDVGVRVAILAAMDQAQERLTTLEESQIGEVLRATFVLNATKMRHLRLQEKLRAMPAIKQLLVFRDPEED